MTILLIFAASTLLPPAVLAVHWHRSRNRRSLRVPESRSRCRGLAFA
jgi:hypothetical protein